MRLTRQTEIAIDVLVACAGSPEKIILTAQAAEYARTSKDQAAHIVRLLSGCGFVNAERGRNGGIGLAIPPHDIRLGDVLRRVQPDLVRYAQAESSDGKNSIAANSDGSGKSYGDDHGNRHDKSSRHETAKPSDVNPLFAAIAAVAENTFLNLMDGYTLADLATGGKSRKRRNPASRMKDRKSTPAIPCRSCEMMHRAVKIGASRPSGDNRKAMSRAAELAK